MVRVGLSRDVPRSWLRFIPRGAFAVAAIVAMLTFSPEAFESSLHTKLDLQGAQLSRIAALIEEQRATSTDNAIVGDNTSTNKNSRSMKHLATNGAAISESDKKTFLEIALSTGTDKVGGQRNWDTQTFKFEAANPRCRTWGHFYHTAYQKWLEPMT